MSKKVQLNSLSVLVEATQSDLHNIELVQEHVAAKNILKSHKSIDRLKSILCYTEEMVPVFQSGDDFLIEHASVIRLMESLSTPLAKVNEEMAIKRICEHNNIPLERTYLVLESEESYRRTVQELYSNIKREKDPARKAELRKTLAGINEHLNCLMENDSINLLRNPNRIDVAINESEEDEEEDDEYDYYEDFIGDEEEDDDEDDDEEDDESGCDD